MDKTAKLELKRCSLVEYSILFYLINVYVSASNMNNMMMVNSSMMVGGQMGNGMNMMSMGSNMQQTGFMGGNDVSRCSWLEF